MSLKIGISYVARTCVTGRMIINELKARGHKAYKLTKRYNDGTFSARDGTNLLIAWGNSSNIAARYCDNPMRINSSTSIKTTANKWLMLDKLFQAKVPVVEFGLEAPSEHDLGLDECRDSKGYFYVRTRKGDTRYDNTFDDISDSHVTKPVPYKRREYRIHIFGGQIFSAYEKVPHDNTIRPPLFKQDNCHFTKIDLTRSRLDANGQAIAIKAVQVLGLDYGAVDLVRDKFGDFVVCEVNSSAGLSTTNVKRLIDLILARGSR